ncbi:hypothetical protein [Nocardioides sp. P5_E3]
MILSRGALIDRYVEDDRSVVMVDEHVLVLSPMATAILEAVPDGALVPLAAVIDHLVAAFGPPEGVEAADVITRAQVGELTACGVLVDHVDGT